MKRGILVLLVGLMVPAVPARAVTLETAQGVIGPEPYQRVADRSRVPTVPGVVAFHTGVCPQEATNDGVQGCQLSDEIWVDVGIPPRDINLMWPWVEMHELGHEFDRQLLGDGGRAGFEKITRIAGDWWTGAYPPGERFADAYAQCAIDPRSTQPGLSRRQQRRVCGLIRRVARRQSPDPAPGRP